MQVKINLGIAQLSMQVGLIKACLAESLLSPGALTAIRQSAQIARWSAAVSLSAFSAMTITRRTNAQGSSWRAIRGPKSERKQRSSSQPSGSGAKKQATLLCSRTRVAT
jgi:hypothetical protein